MLQRCSHRQRVKDDNNIFIFIIIYIIIFLIILIILKLFPFHVENNIINSLFKGGSLSVHNKRPT